MKRPVIFKTIAILLGLSAPAFAQVGFETLTAKAGAYNLWALRVHEAIEVGGLIDSMSGNTLTDVDSDFDALLVPGAPYVVEFNGGVNHGKVVDVVSFSGDTLTVSESLPVDTPLAFAIRGLRRLSEFAGPNQVTGFQQVADFNPDTGDLVLIPAGGGLFNSYFYSSYPGHTGFFNADTGVAEDPLMHYTDAFFYLRRGATNTSAVMIGLVKEWDTRVTISDRFNYVSPVTPVGTLGNISLELSLLSGTAETADIVWLQNPSTGSYKRYFHSDGTAPLGTGWREAGASPGNENVDQSGVSIDWGMIIERRGPLPADVLLVQEITPP